VASSLLLRVPREAITLRAAGASDRGGDRSPGPMCVF
jgi:hypothetical protein